MQASGSLSERMARWLLGHRSAVAALVVLMLGVAVWALPRLSTETGVDPFLDKSLPEYQLHEAVKRRFVSDETLLIAYEAPDLFSARNLQAIRALGEQLSQLRLGPDAFAPISKVESLA